VLTVTGWDDNTRARADSVRLPPSHAKIIVDTATRQFGSGTSVWLFGSRVDDSRRGGDIDLLVEVQHPVANKPREAARFSAALQWHLGDQKIDVIIDDGRHHQPIHTVARQQGKELRC